VEKISGEKIHHDDDFIFFQGTGVPRTGNRRETVVAIDIPRDK